MTDAPTDTPIESPEPAPETAPEPAPAAEAPAAPPARTAADPEAIAAARGAISSTRPAGQAPDDTRAAADADAHPDDPDADTAGLDSTELLEKQLGARVIEEIPHQ